MFGWFARNRRKLERIEDRLDALEWGSGLPREGGGLEALREEIRAQWEAQREQTAQLVEVLKLKPPQAPTLKSLLASDWLVGLRGLPGWGFRFVTDHWQWCLGVGGAAIALGIPAYLQFEANRLQKEANAFSRETLKALSVQIERQDEQIKKQDADTRIVRRAQLLNTIYELEDCDLTEKLAAWEERKKEAEETKTGFFEREPQCDPKAPLRLRQEAVLALARIDGKDLKLNGANLSGADLEAANLSGADLGSADFSGADLGSADFSGADLNDVKLSGVYLINANLSDTELAGADLSGADLTIANLSNAHLSGANLVKANLFAANLRYATFLQANLFAASLHTADFFEADLRDADLINAFLSGANLSNADLSNANLSSANLINANLINANLSNADLINANLSGTNLSGARNLTQEHLNVTCGDSETQIPGRLERLEHWLDRPVQLEDFRLSRGCP